MALPVPIPAKSPAAILDYQMDWSAWLAQGETIVSATVTADAGVTVNPTGKATSVSGGVVTFWLGGGTRGTTYDVEITVTTQSRTDSRTMQVPVGTRVINGVS
jgi:hypothetical protein